MKVVEKINKYVKRPAIKQTELYQYIEKHRHLLEEVNCPFKIKCEQDLFDYEIVVRSLCTKRIIDDAFDMFRTEDDMYQYLDYNERRRLFSQDLKPQIATCPHCLDIDGNDIYLACYEPLINNWYTLDYQMVELKQHREHIDEAHITKDTPFALYGKGVYRTKFSSLVLIFEDELGLVFYSKDFGTLYFYKKETFQMILSITIKPKDCKEDVPMDILKLLTKCFLEQRDKDALMIMHNEGFIDDKIYKKLIKIMN